MPENIPFTKWSEVHVHYNPGIEVKTEKGHNLDLKHFDLMVVPYLLEFLKDIDDFCHLL